MALIDDIYSNIENLVSLHYYFLYISILCIRAPEILKRQSVRWNFYSVYYILTFSTSRCFLSQLSTKCRVNFCDHSLFVCLSICSHFPTNNSSSSNDWPILMKLKVCSLGGGCPFKFVFEELITCRTLVAMATKRKKHTKKTFKIFMIKLRYFGWSIV